MSIQNIMKSVCAAGLLLSSATVFAQDQQAPKSQQAPQSGMQMQKRTPEQRAQRQMQWAQQNLSLTQDQTDKMYNILLTSAKELGENSVNAQQPGEKKALKRDENVELQKVLNPDQYQKYQLHVQDMRQKMQQRRAEMQNGQ